MNFDLNLNTPYDFHQLFMAYLDQKFSDAKHEPFLCKLQELSIHILRMAMQKVEFVSVRASELAVSAIVASIELLRRKEFVEEDKFFGDLLSEALAASRSARRLEEVDYLSMQLVDLLNMFMSGSSGCQLMQFKPLSFDL